MLAGRPLKLVHLQHLTDASDVNAGTFAADPVTPAAFMSQQKQQPTHKSSHRVKRSDTSATAESQRADAQPQSAASEDVVSVQIKGKLITTNTIHQIVSVASCSGLNAFLSVRRLTAGAVNAR